MIIHIARIPVGGESVEGTEPTEGLALDVPELSLPETYSYNLYVCAMGHEVIVTGKLWLEVGFKCGRCGCSFRKRIEIKDFDAQFQLKDRTESIDLTADIRDVILLAFPNYPCCREECKGLCPHCGADLNKRKCRCKPPAGQGEWNALDKLKIK